MAHGSADAVLLRYLPALYGGGSLAGLTDGELLVRFESRAGSGSERAFEALLERHGPMVLRVCRQTLAEAEDVEDAFQATFLVLVRRAGSIRSGDSLASWLYGVAVRVARRARRDAARRLTHEHRRAEPRGLCQASVEPHSDWSDLHEEIARLPEKYREPIVLCYLRGLTTEEAGQWLGCPQGTVLSRLARGRDRLRSRLVRRGLGPAVGMLAAAAGEEALSALPPKLRDATLALAACANTRRLAVATAARAAALAEGVIGTMSLTRWKTIAGAGATLGFVMAGTLALAQQQAAQKQARVGPAPVAPAQAPAPAAPQTPSSGRLNASGTAASPAPNGVRSIEELTSMQARLEMDELQLDIQKELLRKAMVSLGEAEIERPAEDRTHARKSVDELKALVLDNSRELGARWRELDLLAKPGDRLAIEVLETLQGRPLSGERVVRPDGTVGLGYYGEIQVAGLTVRQIKVKVIEHMKQFLRDEVLGLVYTNPEDGKEVRVDPAESDRVYAEFAVDREGSDRDGRIAALERKIDELRNELDQIKGKPPR